MRRLIVYTMIAHATLAAGFLEITTSTPVEAQLAIVVNKSSQVDDISLDQLRRLYLGQSQSLPGSASVSLVVYTPERPSFAEKVLGLQESVFKNRWIGMLFRGEAVRPPVEFSEADEVKQYVRTHPTAIAFLPLGSMDETIKVARVNGKMPSDASYPIR
jgi:ABC-type phosphate transport system substrate-binding protein